MKKLIDPFTILLLSAIVAASLWPAQGETASVLGTLSDIAIGLLFFVHGAALNRQSVMAGATHWRLHGLIFAITFVVFPLAVLPIAALAPQWMPSNLALGFLYLGALPSAVSSSIAFTAVARGNVPAAVCNSAASNVFGMMLTPLLVLLMARTAGGNGLPIGHALVEIFLQLLLPFAAGQLIRPWVAKVMDRNQKLSGYYDQAVILLIVYAAFSQSVAGGLWHRLPLGVLGLAIGLCAALLIAMIALAMFASRRLGFDRRDETVAVFCGSKKTLASGLPMAKVLFAGHPGLGMIVLPIMIYNQIQIIVGAWLARHYERSIGRAEREAPVTA